MKHKSIHLDRENKKYLFFVCVVTIIVIYIFASVQDRANRLVTSKVNYTIAEIIDFNWGYKTSPYFTYNFQIDGKIQKGSYNIVDELALKINNDLSKNYIGKKYFVKYSYEKPKYSELFLYRKVPDSLKNCFECIWETKPWK
ncbi:hypothetical protein [Winogradskyella jejuensis]|uniref:Uncharacterized protein n=1 Tax=Winogradskyella jejuensis TaxID=1089305 RepID=A0A1M5SMF3_9FLAO|nr:hypothetical protein [Winogradskyella jejuensis]SHH39696.1 hypothetical protein SAMN05444148_1909 [Winogradskyella jejuensis]